MRGSSPGKRTSTLALSATPYVQRGTKRGEGYQIDLLIQTRRTIYAVEIKRRRDIGPEVMDEMFDKVRRLKVAHGVSVRTALVYDGKLSPLIEAERGFDVLIPAAHVMEAFDQIFDSIVLKINKLEEMSAFAAQARDTLLPALMSGEMEV